MDLVLESLWELVVGLEKGGKGGIENLRDRKSTPKQPLLEKLKNWGSAQHISAEAMR